MPELDTEVREQLRDEIRDETAENTGTAENTDTAGTTDTAETPRVERPAESRADHRGFRGDIEGLRAVAVLAVMLGHAGVAFLPGGFVGVDVFFVISGFLITSLLVAEHQRTGRISLVGFYARRAKRLLPAAAIVLTATVAGTYLLLPAYRFRGVGWDTVASASYWINWRLSAEAVNYLTADAPPSLLQHFWSLAVEEQFYLIWPLLLIVVGALAVMSGRIRGSRPMRTVYLAGLSLVAVPSLVWSITLTDRDPAAAYFVTTTRLWELALGAGVAIVAGRLARLPRVAAAVLAWAGLAMIGVSVVLITAATAYPGYTALLPTAGAAAVIAGGGAAGPYGPQVLLGLAPMRAIGAISYSLYLWHWPLLVGAEARYGTLGIGPKLLIMLGSFVPAVLTYRLVENPIRRSPALARRPWRALRLGLACSLLPMAGVVAFQLGQPPAAPPLPAGAALGVNALASASPGSTAGAPVDDVGWFTPTAEAARDDIPVVYGDGCIMKDSRSAAKSCVYGDPNGTYTVALVGDSHAAQWFPALQAIALARGWKLITYLKSSCPYIAVDVQGPSGPFPTCTTWNANVRKKLTAKDHPDLVVFSSAATYRMITNGHSLYNRENVRVAGAAEHHAWSVVAAAGARVVVIRDTPRPSFDVPECVGRNEHTLTRCSFDRVAATEAGLMQVDAAAGIPGVHLVDMGPEICPTPRCAVVIGNVLVYRDNNHITATYAATLSTPLGASLDALPR